MKERGGRNTGHTRQEIINVGEMRLNEVKIDEISLSFRGAGKGAARPLIGVRFAGEDKQTSGWLYFCLARIQHRLGVDRATRPPKSGRRFVGFDEHVVPPANEQSG
ncbi:hypothetical protein [uncultured Abyssibacter sp.]|uniref:hypothetical protein n=1 Tax=uncultured Abyssibacter sp. TaxID=2320202 RepID=UPI0032B17B08